MCGHHAEFAVGHELDQVVDLDPEIELLLVGLLVRVGWLVADICVGERHIHTLWT